MDDRSSFHKLWVIESLADGELKTGRNLVDTQLAQAKLSHPDLIVSFESPHSKNQLLHVLNVIRDEAKNIGLCPMIHFECHGSPDGLTTASGEFVEWEELRQSLIEINCACRLNLVIVLAACNGIHLIKVVTKLDRAPFWGVIGPETEVTAGAIERDFGAFYDEFFKSLDGIKALKALNLGTNSTSWTYHFRSAANLFTKAYVHYYKEHCVGSGLESRIEALTDQVLQNPKVGNLDRTWARAQVAERLKNGQQDFSRMKNQFFFIDLFPENRDRFPLSYQDVLAKTYP